MWFGIGKTGALYEAHSIRELQDAMWNEWEAKHVEWCHWDIPCKLNEIGLKEFNRAIPGDNPNPCPYEEADALSELEGEIERCMA